jgi:tetratricopeptide (TPR) repeat protein
VDLVEPHLLTLLSIAPELKGDLGLPAERAAAFAFSREGSPRDWTLRIAHGITDFLLASLRHPASVLFFNVEHADPTDQEFIAVLLRRADPATLSVAMCTGGDTPADDGSVAARAFAAAFGEASVPEDESQLMLAASDLCVRMAYYDAALEWALHGQSMVDRATAPEAHGKLTRNVLFALLLLDRYDEVEAVCTEVLAQASDPALMSHATYAMAILHARYYDAPRRDYDAASAWIEQSQAFNDRLPASETSAVNHAFLMNTMALVEMRKKHEAVALDLLDEALAYMRREAPSKYPLECGILLHNRARLHIAGKCIAEAIADFTELLEVEPWNCAVYFDRGLIQHRAGSYDAALENYDSAIRWSPPYWEAHFNRAQVLTALGRVEEAVADYDRVLVLHPGHIETLINRGRLHFEMGRFAAAEDDATEALCLDAGNARAFCLRGLLAIARKELDAADRDLTAAIAADAGLADAWANRATVQFKMGRFDDALADIDQALTLREDPDIRHNRGRILEACARKGNRRARS